MFIRSTGVIGSEAGAERGKTVDREGPAIYRLTRTYKMSPFRPHITQHHNITHHNRRKNSLTSK